MGIKLEITRTRMKSFITHIYVSYILDTEGYQKSLICKITTCKKCIKCSPEMIISYINQLVKRIKPQFPISLNI